jgi:predicted enzyme related to lactoylglutathione lyase
MNQLLVVSYSVSDVKAMKPFYETLTGMQLAISLTEHVPSVHSYVATGVKLTVNKRFVNEQNAIAHFRVDNLGQAVTMLTQAGGKVISGPNDLPIATVALGSLKANIQKSGGDASAVGNSLGSSVVFADPEGNLVGIIQLAPFAEKAFDRGQLTAEDLAEHQAALQAGTLLQLN